MTLVVLLVLHVAVRWWGERTFGVLVEGGGCVSETTGETEGATCGDSTKYLIPSQLTECFKLAMNRVVLGSEQLSLSLFL